MLNYPVTLPTNHKVQNKQDIMKYIWAFTLGDGSIHKDKRSPNGNARFSATQLAKHEDYILWRASILASITNIRIRYAQYVSEIRPNNKPTLTTVSHTHPIYTELYNRMYNNGCKRIDPHHIRWLDWEVLAILYQDDGCLWFNSSRKTSILFRPTISLSTQSFTYSDNMLLSKVFYEKLGIHFNVRRRTHRGKIIWLQELKRSDTFKFINGIKPYIQPSFHYKIDLERMNVSDYYKTDRMMI